MSLPEMGKFLDLLREKGVVRYKDGEFEIVMGPPPMAFQSKDTKVKNDPPALAARRAHYEQLLNRPVADAELEQLP